MRVDDWPRCFLRLHADFDWFLPLGGLKEGTSFDTPRRPGFARAINGSEVNFTSNLEYSPPTGYVYSCELKRSSTIGIIFL